MTRNNCEIIEVERGELLERSTSLIASELSIDAAAASQIVDQFDYAELSGKKTHGFVRVPWLVGQNLEGHEPISIERDHGAPITYIDCTKSIGYLAANEIANYVKESAAESEARMVIAQNIFPTNTLGYYLRNIIEDGSIIGILFGTTPKLVCGPGMQNRLIGTNPLAVGFQEKGVMTISDITTAQSSLGELLVAKYWGGFKAENFKTSAGETPRTLENLYEGQKFNGSITQSVEQKGDRKLYSLSLVVQSLMNVISPNKNNRGNLAFIAVNRSFFSPAAGLESTQELISGLDPNLMPGMRSHRRYEEGLKQPTVSLPASLWSEIKSS